MQDEPIHDIAHLGHVEILTDKPEESLDFFTRVYGLSESGREGDSVYLRAFDDYEFHSLKLTAAKTTGMRHVGYRAASPQALERRVKAIEALGAGIGWSDGDAGHGPAYQFQIPTATSSRSITRRAAISRRRIRSRRSRTRRSARPTAPSRRAASTISICSPPTSTPSATSCRRRSAAASPK